MIQLTIGSNYGFAAQTTQNPTEYHDEQTRRRGLQPLFKHQPCH